MLLGLVQRASKPEYAYSHQRSDRLEGVAVRVCGEPWASEVAAIVPGYSSLGILPKHQMAFTFGPDLWPRPIASVRGIPKPTSIDVLYTHPAFKWGKR